MASAGRLPIFYNIVDFYGRMFKSDKSPAELQIENEAKDGRIRSIVCIFPSQFDQALLTVPALQPIRESFPFAQISVLTTTSIGDTLDGHPCIDHVFKVDASWLVNSNPSPPSLIWETVQQVKATEPDLVIDFCGDFRLRYLFAWKSQARFRVGVASEQGGWILTNSTNEQPGDSVRQATAVILSEIGCSGQPGALKLDSWEQDNEFTERYLSGAPHPWIGINCDSELNQEIASQLAETLHDSTGGTIIFFGRNPDSEVSRGFVAPAVDDDWRKTQAVVSKLNLLITGDCALFYLAKGHQTPIVALTSEDDQIDYEEMTRGCWCVKAGRAETQGDEKYLLKKLMDGALKVIESGGSGQVSEAA